MQSSRSVSVFHSSGTDYTARGQGTPNTLLKLLGLPSSIGRPAASLYLWAWPRQTTYKRNVGQLVGERQQLRLPRHFEFSINEYQLLQTAVSDCCSKDCWSLLYRGIQNGLHVVQHCIIHGDLYVCGDNYIKTIIYLVIKITCTAHIIVGAASTYLGDHQERPPVIQVRQQERWNVRIVKKDYRLQIILVNPLTRYIADILCGVRNGGGNAAWLKIDDGTDVWLLFQVAGHMLGTGQLERIIILGL